MKVYAHTSNSGGTPFNNVLDFDWSIPNTATANKLVPQEEANWSVICNYDVSVNTVGCYAVYDTSE